MSNLSRTILHCTTGTSDKVYVLDINQLAGKVKKPYVVMTTWGPREATRLSSQIKDEFATVWEATSLVTKMVKDKGKAGYRTAAANLKIPGLKSLGLDLSKIVENNMTTPKTRDVTMEIIDLSQNTRKIKL